MWQDSHALITPNIAAGPLNGGMFSVDRIVEERVRDGGPIRVAMVGAGPLARVIALQLATDLPEVRLVGIADDDLDAARHLCAAAGMPVPRVVESRFGLCSAIRAGDCAITQDWRLLCESEEIDAVIEATDAAAHASDAVRIAAESGKHVIPTSVTPDDNERDPARDRIELVPVRVDATNFFDIVRSDDEGPPGAFEADRRPSAPA